MAGSRSNLLVGTAGARAPQTKLVRGEGVGGYGALSFLGTPPHLTRAARPDPRPDAGALLQHPFMVAARPDALAAVVAKGVPAIAPL